jgi:cobaltochelatase CobN
VTSAAPMLPPENAAWAAFHRVPPQERRVVVVLDRGDAAALRAASMLLGSLGDEGFAVESSAGPAPLAEALAGAEAEPLSRADYAGFFAALPRAEQDGINARWGAPEADPAFRPGRLDCGTLLVPVLRLGHVALAVRRTPEARPLSHGDLAIEAWAEDAFRAHAIAHLAVDGTLTWTLGESLKRAP